MPEISVIVPVYNAGKYLARCVESILAQTFTDFELILVDDGSTDNSPVLCDHFTGRDSRVKVIHQKNAGVSAARNAGINTSCSDWICFVDSDDLIHHQFLSELFSAVCKNKVAISMCSATEATEVPKEFYNKKECGFTTVDVNELNLEKMLLQGGHRCYTVWGKLINRKIIIHEMFEEGRIFEDNAVVIYWLTKAERIADTQQALYFYAINPSGISKSGMKYDKPDRLWAIEENVKLFSQLGYNSLMKRFCTEYLITAAHYYHEAKKRSSDRQVRLLIKSSIKKFQTEYRNSIDLSTDESLTVNEVFHPLYVRIYRGMSNAKKRIRNK